MKKIKDRPRPQRLDARQGFVLEFDLDLLDRSRRVSSLFARLWRSRPPRCEKLPKH